MIVGDFFCIFFLANNSKIYERILVNFFGELLVMDIIIKFR